MQPNASIHRPPLPVRIRLIAANEFKPYYNNPTRNSLGIVGGGGIICAGNGGKGLRNSIAMLSIFLHFFIFLLPLPFLHFFFFTIWCVMNK